MNTWLNYHHLYYFWIIKQEKSISAAAERLRLAQPTLSAQLKQLESNLDTQLFERRGKNLFLTDDGEVVGRYAEEIFTLGGELQAVLKGSRPTFDLRLRVGITDSLPKFVVYKTLLPIYQMKDETFLECYEGKREDLLSELAAHRLDLVLTDAPFASEIAVKAYNHPIGSSGISLFGTKKLIQSLKGSGSKKFNHAPFILPTRNTMLRRTVDEWFEAHEITPKIVAEFEDSALLKTFGSEGIGFFPIASSVEKEVQRHYNVTRATKLQGAEEKFYAISLERKITHPAILAVTKG